MSKVSEKYQKGARQVPEKCQKSVRNVAEKLQKSGMFAFLLDPGASSAFPTPVQTSGRQVAEKWKAPAVGLEVGLEVPKILWKFQRFFCAT